MGVFFTSWELWQDMSFVLACAILVVVALGLAKLWWTNRKLREYEIIEAERRSRLAEMRHCGIHSLGTSEIPFGVRALESGVEVDGIWVSRSNTPHDSEIAPSVILMDEPTRKWKGKEKMGDTSLPNGLDTSDSSAMGNDRPFRSRTPAISGIGHSTGSSSDRGDSASEAEMLATNARCGPWRQPTELYQDSRALQGFHISSDVDSDTPWPFRTQQSFPGPDPSAKPRENWALGDAAMYGSAAVYANRSTRRLNAGFEVLPAGVLGPRQEFSSHIPSDPERTLRYEATPHRASVDIT